MSILPTNRSQPLPLDRHSVRVAPCRRRLRVCGGVSQLLCGLLASVALVGCMASSGERGGTRSGPLAATTAGGTIDHLDERALLLLVADRRALDPFVVAQAQAGPPSLREALAESLGRVGDPAALPTLELLLFDPEPAVRRAAAFALGELGTRDGAAALLRATTDPDRETGALAVEAAGKLGVAVAEVVNALALPKPGSLASGPSSEDEQRARLLPYLFRFREEGMVEIAESALVAATLTADLGLAATIHRGAAYALCREPVAAGRSAIRRLVSDPDPWLRGFAARALGTVGEAADLERLRPLLDDPQPGPTVHALRSARRLIAEGRAVVPPSWLPRLLELVADPRPGVRVTAIEAAEAWLGDDSGAVAVAETPLGAVLAAKAAGLGGSRREREVALLALAGAAGRRVASGADVGEAGPGLRTLALDLLAKAADDADAVLRARAAEAAAKLPPEPEAHSVRDAGPEAPAAVSAGGLLSRLGRDVDPGVRGAAFAARLERLGDDLAGGAALARIALRDPDPVVRASALEWASEHPLLTLDELTAAVFRARGDRGMPDALLAATAAVAARGKAEALERGGAIALLEELAGDRQVLVRRRAGEALREAGAAPPPVGPVATGLDLSAYRSIVQQTAAPRFVELATSRGSLRVRLECPRAPLTCLNFLKLAASGYFDGLSWHRVVPDFVAQAGDPRGDGSGGPGYEIRDEVNRLRYGRGAMGMALSGPDTGGSQFFFTLAPQPHLDGGYTVFGQVVAGDAVLDQLVQGDRIVRVREIDG